MYQFNFTAWPDFGVPKNPAAIIDFLATVNSKQAELTEAGPMVIHCRSGLNLSMDKVKLINGHSQTCP